MQKQTLMTMKEKITRQNGRFSSPSITRRTLKENRFKLHLQPKQSKRNGAKIPSLPRGKSAVQVYADFLRYMMDCVKLFIESSHANGPQIWEGERDFVLVSNCKLALFAAEVTHITLQSHPNGWSGPQHAKLREGAILAGIIPNSDVGRAHIKFITEGEASLYACLQGGLTDDLLKAIVAFVITRETTDTL